MPIFTKLQLASEGHVCSYCARPIIKGSRYMRVATLTIEETRKRRAHQASGLYRPSQEDIQDETKDSHNMRRLIWKLIRDSNAPIEKFHIGCFDRKIGKL